jgi:ribosome biogenesis protein Nip4
MMEKLNSFVERFGVRIKINEELVIKKGERYFLINNDLVSNIRTNFIYAGAYFGEMKEKEFSPSFILLEMIGRKAKALNGNYAVVNEKSEWLFICGRDIFRRGIISISGSRMKGSYTLILNQYDECLGFGRILHDKLYRGKKRDKVMIKNVLDIGDFLRRERY